MISDYAVKALQLFLAGEAGPAPLGRQCLQVSLPLDYQIADLIDLALEESQTLLYGLKVCLFVDLHSQFLELGQQLRVPPHGLLLQLVPAHLTLQLLGQGSELDLHLFLACAGLDQPAAREVLPVLLLVHGDGSLL